MANKTKKPMSKGLIYTLFILKFLLGLALIYWTIYMTLSSDVGEDEDKAFLSTYHEVDNNFNDILQENYDFEQKYNVKFQLNEHTIDGLTFKDVFLAQRAIQQRTIRKNIIKIGDNKFTVSVQDKNGNEVKNKNIQILVTKNTNHLEDVELQFNNENTKEFKIKSKGYWNITGTIEVDGNKGSFYIKTNASDNAK
jgi:nitrogen fixation protein FixH